MIKVKFHKSCREYLSKSAYTSLQNAVNFALDYHGIRTADCTLRIYVREIIDAGWGDGYRTVGQQTMFGGSISEIELLSGRNRFATIKTFFHEITHLKQHLTAQSLGVKKSVLFPEYASGDFHSYRSAPEEVDARMHANRMFRLWIWQNIAFWKKGTHNES